MGSFEDSAGLALGSDDGPEQGDEQASEGSDEKGSDIRSSPAHSLDDNADDRDEPGGREDVIVPKQDKSEPQDHETHQASAVKSPAPDGSAVAPLRRTSSSDKADPSELVGQPRLLPVPPLRVPGINIDTLTPRGSRTARTARKMTRAQKMSAKTVRGPMRPPFWQGLGTVQDPGVLPETPDVHPGHNRFSMQDIEAKIKAMLGDEEMDGEGAAVRGQSREELTEAKRMLDKSLLKTAAREGFRVMSMYRKRIGNGTAWAPLTRFRYIVNAELHLLIRIERDIAYVPGTRRPETTPEAELAHLKGGEIITATWNVKDFYRVERITGTFENEDLVGCAFSVWVQIGALPRPLHFWAPGAEGEARMEAFSRALEIASSRLMYLGVKLGSKALPSLDTKRESSTPHPTQTLRLGIADKRTMVELAEKPKELRSLVTSGALELRGHDESSVWTKGYKTTADDLRLVISRTWNNIEQRRKVAEKLRLAGVLTCNDLVELVETGAPADAASYLPPSSFFRGQVCLLNYRIDVNGGKLLKSSTMEKLHKLSLLPIDAEVGYGPAHGYAPVAKDSRDLFNLVLALWPNAKDAQDGTFDKLVRAGARNVAQLCELITEEGPAGCVLPDSTFFRGRSCMLNFNIDEMGGKLFSTTTLETLYSRGVYQTMFDVSNSQYLLKRMPASADKNKAMKSQQDKAVVEEQKAQQRRMLHLQSVLETATEESEGEIGEILFNVSAADKVLQVKAQVTHVSISHDCHLLALARADGIVTVRVIEIWAHAKGAQAKDWKAVPYADLHWHHDTINYTSWRPADSEAYLPHYVSSLII